MEFNYMKQQDWIDFSKQSTDVIQVSKKWLKQPIEANLSEKLPNKLSKQQKNSHKKRL